MSGVVYLLGGVLLAAIGIGLLWLVEAAPRRDPLGGVEEFNRARSALRRTPSGSSQSRRIPPGRLPRDSLPQTQFRHDIYRTGPDNADKQSAADYGRDAAQRVRSGSVGYQPVQDRSEGAVAQGSTVRILR
jgi:hypothetical protein